MLLHTLSCFLVGLLPLANAGASDDSYAKIFNKTIERVSAAFCRLSSAGMGSVVSEGVHPYAPKAPLRPPSLDGYFFHAFSYKQSILTLSVQLVQTVSLRTHSIFAPYIDQDLQNRFVGAQS